MHEITSFSSSGLVTTRDYEERDCHMMRGCLVAWLKPQEMLKKLFAPKPLRRFPSFQIAAQTTRTPFAGALWSQQQFYTSRPSPDLPTSSSSSPPPNSRPSTIDADEIRKFSAKSAEWWDPHGEFAMLHLMNPARVEYVREIIAGQKSRDDTLFTGMRVLDIGCGGGLLSESMAKLGAQVVGADASYENIQMAKLHARKDPALWVGPGSLEYQNTTAGPPRLPLFFRPDPRDGDPRARLSSVRIPSRLRWYGPSGRSSRPLDHLTHPACLLPDRVACRGHTAVSAPRDARLEQVRQECRAGGGGEGAWRRVAGRGHEGDHVEPSQGKVGFNGARGRTLGDGGAGSKLFFDGEKEGGGVM
ncbi:hypothetical protein BC937DRAFT_95185 [Endogone sp. FLAS-F59071]|nr:hypothetical protein BC937DRAFT_95185 [Endogone sp. FLAS-F59071]|eukprot:RUS20454.1 hypothetical protein BC937DRAFT_95185 [Endogone sp. FLAS-F59071]